MFLQIVSLLTFVSLQLTSGVVVMTTSGQQCRFPFVYRSITYNRCITIDAMSPWCAITEEEVTFSGLNMNTWGYCEAGGAIVQLPKGCPINTELGTTCKLAYMAEGRIQTQCLWPNGKQPTCLDQNNQLANCVIDQTLEGKQCYFPTTYIDGDGTEYVYDQCTRKNARFLWCATDATPLRYKDGSTNWGECFIPDCYMGEE